MPGVGASRWEAEDFSLDHTALRPHLPAYQPQHLSETTKCQEPLFSAQ